jgi:hypothetical protein
MHMLNQDVPVLKEDAETTDANTPAVTWFLTTVEEQKSDNWSPSLLSPSLLSPSLLSPSLRSNVASRVHCSTTNLFKDKQTNGT